ncbi:hypothetical protein GCM10028805_49280 [Spirosoma harenae]
MRQFVIGASIIADLLDFTGVGHFFYVADIIVIVLHMLHAGPKALLGILDMIPGVGLIPVFTFLSLSYKDE